MPELFHRRGSAFFAHNATLFGDVVVGEGVNLWFNAVVRGDISRISLGDNVNLQDGVIVHTDSGIPCDVEAGVVAGHNAIIHGRSVGADTLIGMGAIFLSGSVIGPECIIAAGCVVPERMIVPARCIVMGVPGRIIKSVSDEQLAKTKRICRDYRERAENMAQGKHQNG